MDTRFKAPFGEHQAYNRGGYRMQRRGTYSQRGGRQVFMRDNIQQDRQVGMRDNIQRNRQVAMFDNIRQDQQAFGNDQPVNKQAYRNNFEQSHRNNFAQAQRGPFLCDGNAFMQIPIQQDDGDDQNEPVKKREKFGEAKDGQRGNFGQTQFGGKTYKPTLNQQNDANAPGKLIVKRVNFDEEKECQPNNFETILLQRRIDFPIKDMTVSYAGFLIGEKGATAKFIRQKFDCVYSVVGQSSDERMHIKIYITAPAIEAYKRMHRVVKYVRVLLEKAHAGEVPAHHKIKNKHYVEEDEVKSLNCTLSKSIIDKTFAETLQIEVDNSDAITQTQRHRKLVDSPNTAEVVSKLGIRKSNEFVYDSIGSSDVSFAIARKCSPRISQRQTTFSPVPKTQKPIKIVDVNFSSSNCLNIKQLNINSQAKLPVCDERSNQLIKEAHNQITKHDAVVEKNNKKFSFKEKLAMEFNRITQRANGDVGFAGTDTILTSTFRSDIPPRFVA